MTSKTEKPVFDFDTLQVPMDLGVVKVPTTPEMLNLYRESVDDPRESFLVNALKGGGALGRGSHAAFQRKPGEVANINAGHEAEFFNLPTPGKKLFLHRRIIDKAVRRGKPYITIETDVKDEDGLPITRMSHILMVRSQELGRKFWAKPTKDTQVGAELDPLTRHVTFDKMVKFEKVHDLEAGLGAGVSQHTDHEIARQAGHREPIASAFMQISYIHSMLNNFFGPDWVKGGKLSLRFTRPVVNGDTVTSRGEVTDKVPEDGRTRLVLKVWSENQRGQITSVGTASGLVD